MIEPLRERECLRCTHYNMPFCVLDGLQKSPHDSCKEWKYPDKLLRCYICGARLFKNKGILLKHIIDHSHVLPLFVPLLFLWARWFMRGWRRWYLKRLVRERVNFEDRLGYFIYFERDTTLRYSFPRKVILRRGDEICELPIWAADLLFPPTMMGLYRRYPARVEAWRLGIRH